MSYIKSRKQFATSWNLKCKIYSIFTDNLCCNISLFCRTNKSRSDRGLQSFR
nr:MAG TPA: hypothetical protein [Caudoviricetes sp.]